MTPERIAFWSLLAATFAIRAAHPGQPIVENYVGRQVPTAMVARNLERGSGFLRPQLDTGPFPNLFLVEPPIYAQLVAWARALFGFDWGATGRIVSAAATTLAAWGLFGLVARREGPTAAFLAVASFGVLPVMVRYGRAFQPDALMLGCLLAGLRGWDEFGATGDRRWAAFGGFVLSLGLAVKVTSAWALIPYALIVPGWPIGRRLAASAAMLAPALAWYGQAWPQVAHPGGGSMASLDNARMWADSAFPTAWLRSSTWAEVGRNLVVRSFTPVGFVLAGWGWAAGGKVDRLWLGWGVGCSLAIVGLAAKWHHGYYWMAVAPPAAVGIARGLLALRSIRPSAAWALGSFFLGCAAYQSAPTWRTPPEWASLGEAADAIQLLTGDAELILAPEAVLYAADRKGFRLEFAPAAARRAAGEWGSTLPDSSSPLGLTECYLALASDRPDDPSSPIAGHARSATPPGRGRAGRRILAADVGPVAGDAGRRDWREAIRGRPGTRLLIDRPDLMIAILH